MRNITCLITGLFKHVLGEKLYFNHFMKLIRLATKISPYNSFMPQRFCNTLEHVNSKQITKEYIFKKVSHSKHEKICSDMN